MPVLKCTNGSVFILRHWHYTASQLFLFLASVKVLCFTYVGTLALLKVKGRTSPSGLSGALLHLYSTVRTRKLLCCAAPHGAIAGAVAGEIEINAQ